MTRKISDQPLQTLEQRFQILRDKASGLPEASRKELETACQDLSQAIAALRAAREAEMRPAAEIPSRQEAPRHPESESLWPLGPTAGPERCETILSHLFMAIPELFNIVDRDFHILMSNWHGPGESLPEAARRGRPKCHQLFWGREHPCEDCQVQEVFATGQIQKRQRFHPMTGRFLEISAFPIRDESGRVVLVADYVRDITERHRAEEALRESEERFRTIFENAQDSIFIKDRSQRYTMANAAMGRLLDRSVADLIGRSDRELFGEEGAAGIRQIDQRVLNGEVVKGVHTVPIQGVPTTFHIIIFPLKDDAGEVMAVCGIARDITELKQTEEALRQSETKYRTLVENIPQKVFIKNRESRFVSINQNLAQDLGIRPEEALGKVDYDFFPRELADKYRADDQRIMETGRTENIEERYIQEGQEVWVNTIKTPVKDENDNIVGVLGTFFDITERKQAEQALKESEERFRAIFETAQDSIFIKDRSLRYIQVNPAMAQLFSRPAADLIGKTDAELFGEEAATFIRENDLRVLNGEVVKEAHTKPVQGVPMTFHVIKVPLHDDTGEIVALCGIVRDISDMKRAKEALEESETRYRTLFETSPDAICVMDLQTNIIMENWRGIRLFGYGSEAEALNRSAIDNIAPEDRPQAMATFRELLETGQTQTFEVTMLKNDGTRFPSLSSTALIRDAAGNPQAILGVARDITALKQAEAELRQSEQKLRLMAESIQDVFWMATVGMEKMVYVSPAYEQIWGRSCAELYQYPLSFIEGIHPEDRERVRSGIAAGEAQGVPWSEEYRVVKPDGAVRWIQDRGFPVRDDQGRIIWFTGVATDVTECKVLEQQLLQAQKMEAVGRLAGGVAHDFNNLLMAIMGYSELMRAKVHRGDPLYQHLENILRAGDQASALTQQLLAFSRRQIVRPQVIDLKQVIHDLETMLQRVLGEDIELEIISDPMPMVVKGDPGHLSQIIMNLVVNARDAMPRGGRLTLKTAPVDFPMGCHTRFGLTPPGAYVALEVRDTGVGMDEATQAHIFEPFFTTKEMGKGTGLGLSTVYGIVKQSGGYLDLASEPGQGAAFTIYLPRLEGAVQQPRAKIPITEALRGEETILLVEDEDVLRALLAKFLRLYGYAVLEARHGGEALLICERHQGPIQLMVTDVVMPQMSGRELADRLIPLRPEMQVLYMSGYTDDIMVHHGVADLSVPFLQKPFKPIELARLVHNVLHPGGQP
jgi:two-component system cell cycle sensor histidine kinase/response regulator CckA